jgi:PPOX class probable F420-dependent enzyme
MERGVRRRKKISPRLSPAAFHLLRSARVAHLATADRKGRPHVVPICFAVDGWELFTPLDEKPKKSPPLRLKRARNIILNPKVAVLVDHYEENWRRLTYILIHGRAMLAMRGKKHRKAVRLLRKKYSQYRSMRLEERPVIIVRYLSAHSWAAKDA